METTSPQTGERFAKTIKMSRELDLALKRLAFEKSQAEGRRVTESELIEQALKAHFGL